MGNFGRDDRGGRSSFGGGRRSFGGDRGGSRGGFGGRPSFGGGRGGFGGGRSDGPREMFDAVCDNCGKNCQVPFRPTSGKPVYCSDCFEKVGGNDRNEGRSSHFAPQGGAPRDRNDSPRIDSQNKVQLDSLNAKLDKIIALLEVNAPKAKVVKVAKKVLVKEEAPVTPVEEK